MTHKISSAFIWPWYQFHLWADTDSNSNFLLNIQRNNWNIVKNALEKVIVLFNLIKYNRVVYSSTNCCTRVQRIPRHWSWNVIIGFDWWTSKISILIGSKKEKKEKDNFKLSFIIISALVFFVFNACISFRPQNKFLWRLNRLMLSKFLHCVYVFSFFLLPIW